MTWAEHHAKSERLAAAAEGALRVGHRKDAEDLYARAAAAEDAALLALPEGKPRTKGITAVSVVALFYKGSQYDAAEYAAYRALAGGGLPQFAVTQLQHLLGMLWAAAAASRSGRRFVPGDVLVSVKGGLVVHGGAPLDLIQQKVDGVQAVLFRVIEFLLGRELRKRGAPTADILEAFRPWLFQAPAGSYQFAVRVEEPAQRTLFESDRPKVDEVTSTFFAILRASAADPDGDLLRVVPDAGYRHAFLGLSRNLAPTGKSFDRLEIWDASAPALQPVVLGVDSRRELNGVLKRDRPASNRGGRDEIVEVRGVLRGLQLDRDWIEVVTESAQTTRVHQVGTVLDDVVGPMVNHRVMVVARRKAKRLVFLDIEPDE